MEPCGAGELVDDSMNKEKQEKVCEPVKPCKCVLRASSTGYKYEFILIEQLEKVQDSGAIIQRLITNI